MRLRASCLACILALAFVPVASTAQSALRVVEASPLGSALEGDVTREGLEKWIFIESFSVSAGNPSGVPEFRPLEFSKASDKTDPGFLRALVTGEPLDQVCALSFADGPDGLLRLSEIRLGRARVINMTPSSSGEGRIQQTISLAYSQITLVNFTINPDGTQGEPEIFCFDAEKGTECPPPPECSKV